VREAFQNPSGLGMPAPVMTTSGCLCRYCSPLKAIDGQVSSTGKFQPSITIENTFQRNILHNQDFTAGVLYLFLIYHRLLGRDTKARHQLTAPQVILVATRRATRAARQTRPKVELFVPATPRTAPPVIMHRLLQFFLIVLF
jgi:hypothetical protein